MRTTIRLFLLIEGVSFLAAGLIHRGVFISGYAHQQAAIAETVIAIALLIALGLTWIWPAQTRLIALLSRRRLHCSARWSASSPSPSVLVRVRRPTLPIT